MEIAVGELLERARRERQRQNHLGAIAAFTDAVAMEPSNTLAKIELAAELRAGERLDEAEALVRAILATAPHQIQALVELGHIEQRRGNHEAAAAAYQAAAIANPDNRNIKVELARTFLTLNRLDEAAAITNDILRADPHHVGALVERGHLLRRLGDQDGAIAAFQSAASFDPSNRNIQVELARDLRRLERLDEAERILLDIIEVEPRHVGASIERGHLLRQQGNREAAAVAFQHAAHISPQHLEIKVELARELRALNRLEEAQRLLRSVIETRADHAGAWIELAQVYHCAGDFAGRLEALEAATRASPSNFDVKISLSSVHGDRGNFSEAMRLLEEVLSTATNHETALIHLGRLHRLCSDTQKAIDTLRRVPQASPNYAAALVELAYAIWGAGNLTSAREVLASALARDQTNLGGLVASAELASASGDARLALQMARRAIDYHPDQVGPYLLAARTASDLLNLKEAEELLDRARAKFGRLPEITVTRIHILRLHREYDAARAVILECGEEVKSNFDLLMQAISFSIAQGEFDRAEEALNSALAETSRKASRLHFLRGSLFEARRQYSEAVTSYEAAIALETTEPEWHESAARCFLLLADTNRARMHLRAAAVLRSGINRVQGKSSNISQNHLGQLLDEFLFDREVLDRLQQICSLPIEERMNPLARLVADNPDQTAPSILLLLTMRQSARLLTIKSGASDTGDARGIPKRIAHYWHSPNPPEDVRRIVATWRQIHPDFEHVFFDDDKAMAFLQSISKPAASKAFRRGSTPAQRADILRLAYLSSVGGFFVDADDRCLAPIDSYIPEATEFVGYQESYGTIGVNFLGARATHPVIRLAFDRAVEAVNRGDRDVLWLSTGPGLLTRAFAQLLLPYPNGLDWLDRTKLLELSEFQRVVGVYCPAAYKSA
jgi:tetratricopeptide (TPR) repeat protein